MNTLNKLIHLTGRMMNALNKNHKITFNWLYDENTKQSGKTHLIGCTMKTLNNLVKHI